MTTLCRISTTTIVLCVLTLMTISANAQNAGSDTGHPPGKWAVLKSLPEEITNSIGMKLKLIPAGEFMMGWPNLEVQAWISEKPQHRVRITKPFYMGVYEVT